MLDITNYQRSANQKYKEVPLQSEWPSYECGDLHCWWVSKLVKPTWKTVWRFLRKLETELSCDLATIHLGIYLDKTIIQKD